MSKRLTRFFANADAREVTGKEDMIAPERLPSVDVSETDEAFDRRAELPEVGKDHVHITADHGVLTLQGERKQEGGSRGRDGEIHGRRPSYPLAKREQAKPKAIDVKAA